MNRIRVRHDVAVLALLVPLIASLPACGGGSSDTAQSAPQPQPQDGVPASASTSVQGLNAWMKPLVAVAAAVVDAMEPMDVSGFKPPTSETDEPDPLV